MENSLKGKEILITREKSQAQSFAYQIEVHGGKPIIVPLLKIETVENEANKELIQSINQFDWIFFTSINGVNHFFEQLADETVLENIKIAVVGHKTEAALIKYGYKAHFIPTIYNADTMAEEFVKAYGKDMNVLFVRGNLSRPNLLDYFSKEEISHSLIVVYDTIINKEAKRALNKALREGLDYLTFTSPSTVKAFIELIDDESLLQTYKGVHSFCIGTTTENFAIVAGFTKTFIPDTFTIESMVENMITIAKAEEF